MRQKLIYYNTKCCIRLSKLNDGGFWNKFPGLCGEKSGRIPSLDLHHCLNLSLEISPPPLPENTNNSLIAKKKENRMMKNDCKTLYSSSYLSQNLRSIAYGNPLAASRRVKSRQAHRASPQNSWLFPALRRLRNEQPVAESKTVYDRNACVTR